jgi:hypothetical protein
MTSIGNSYISAADASSVTNGGFFLDLTGPNILTVANVDSNFLTAFPLSTAYAKSISGPGIAKTTVYYWDCELAATLWIDLTSEATPATGVTSYTVLDYVTRVGQIWDANTQFYISTEFFRTGGSAGPTGPTGPSGP